MIRTKTNFKPLTTASSGSGDTLNENITDGLALIGANSDKVTIDTLNKMDKLEQPTPFDMSDMPNISDM